MKVEASDSVILLTAESDFEVLSLKRFEKMRMRSFICTYEKDESRFGKNSKASGFLKIEFDEVEKKEK